MKEFVISEAKAETAILVGLITGQQDEAKTNEYLDELEFLATTAGARTVKRFTQKVGGPSSVTYVGSGKLEEIRQYIKMCEDAYDEAMEHREDYESEADMPQPISPCVHRQPRPRRRWNWHSIAICCPDCSDSGRTWSVRAVALAAVAAREAWDCVDLVRRSWRWTAVSSCTVSPC